MDGEPFPWHLGIFDAHCHPTDTMSSIRSIPNMKARVLTVMATRAQDQELVASAADEYGVKSRAQDSWTREERMVPCFGWHPWFSHQMHFNVNDDSDQVVLQGEDKIRHYQSVLQPSRTDLSEDDRKTFLSLPDPMPLSNFVGETKKYLEKYPFALVGEVGLDRSFRIPEAWIPEHEESRNGALTPGGREGRRLSPYRVDLKHQKKVFKAQLQLAAEMDRAVSIHGVQAHGMVFETLKELYQGHEKQVLSRRQRKKQAQDQSQGEGEGQEEPNSGDADRKPYPPRICLHSYSGNPSNFKQYTDPKIPIEIFASFSTAINLSDALEEETPSSFVEMIKSVPDHMLLIESDLHTAGDGMDKRLSDIVRRVCKIKEWDVEHGTRILAANWTRFVFGER